MRRGGGRAAAKGEEEQQVGCPGRCPGLIFAVSFRLKPMFSPTSPIRSVGSAGVTARVRRSGVMWTTPSGKRRAWSGLGAHGRPPSQRPGAACARALLVRRSLTLLSHTTGPAPPRPGHGEHGRARPIEARPAPHGQGMWRWREREKRRRLLETRNAPSRRLTSNSPLSLFCLARPALTPSFSISLSISRCLSYRPTSPPPPPRRASTRRATRPSWSPAWPRRRRRRRGRRTTWRRQLP